jgi:peptide/nickel transport system substrate-binding protein
VTDSPTGERSVSVALLQDVDSLNPFLGAYLSSVQLFRLTYDYLTDYSPVDNHPVPGLAESWTTSRDGLRWTFRIRRGVRWSDGAPLTAADIAFTYQVLMRHPTAANASSVKTFHSVAAPDPTTLVVQTKAPTPTMLALDVPIVPAHVWRTRDPLDEAGIPVVGSGPFRLVEARPSRFYRLARNPGYWRGAPRTAEVIFRAFTSSDAAVLALRKGEVEVVPSLTPAQYDALGGDLQIGRNEARGGRFNEVKINPGAARTDGTPIGDGNPALRDRRVRVALEYAIDRRLLVARVFGGHGEPGAGYFPGTYRPWSWQPPAGLRRDFDPARAERILDGAGYRRGPDGIRRLPGGQRRLALRLFVPGLRAYYQQSAGYLAAWWQRVGVEVDVRVMSDTQVSAQVGAGRYDLALGGWTLDPDPDYLLSVQTCGARPQADGPSTTDTFSCDAGYDDLYARQAVQIDPGARLVIVRELQRRMYEDGDRIVLYYPALLEAYRADRFTGFVRRPAGTGSIAGAWSYVSVTAVAPSRPTGGRTGVLVFAIGVSLAAAAGAAAAWRSWVSRGHRP